MRVQVNGIRLFFDVEGAKLLADGPAMRERPTVVLLHGAPGFADHSILRPQLSPLADVAQLVYLDLRGCGRSDAGPEDRWTIEQWADDLRAFCDALGIRRPVVFSQASGCFVAMAYAIRHPEHPAKLLLSSPQARLSVARSAAAFERVAGREAAAAARAWLDGQGDAASFAEYMRLCTPYCYRTPQDPDMHSRLVANPGLWLAFHAPGGIWHRTNLLPDLHRIRCPTLILAGEEDPVTPLEDALEVAAALPAALVRLERFPGCAHGPWRDDPVRVLAAIREFLLA